MSYCEQILQLLFFGEIIEILENTFKSKVNAWILSETHKRSYEIQRGKSLLCEPVEENVK